MAVTFWSAYNDEDQANDVSIYPVLRLTCEISGKKNPDTLVGNFFSEPLEGIEPSTSSLPRKCSTTEPQRPLMRVPRNKIRLRDRAAGAERKNRIELSSSAWKAEVIATIRLPLLETLAGVSLLWAVMDSNHRRPKSADLQSAPFSHSGNYPKK